MNCKWLLSILILIVSVCVSCRESRKTIQNNRLESMIGVRITSIDSVLSGLVSETNIIMICSVYDCGSCLAAAFSEVEEVNRQLASGKVQIIGVLTDPTPLQTRFSYFDYIAFDADDMIRRQLKYIPTPVFIIYDKDKKVRFFHAPSSSDNVSSVSSRLAWQSNSIVRSVLSSHL